MVGISHGGGLHPSWSEIFLLLCIKISDKLFVASVVRANQRDPLYFAFFGGEAESCSRLP